jgi:hypothetical protein
MSVKELTVEQRNDLFFERHDIALTQERAVAGPYTFLGENTEDAHLQVSRKEVGKGGRRAELVLTTPGHEWFLLEDWTDDLYEWLGKVIEARRSAKLARLRRKTTHRKNLEDAEEKRGC